jgi:hypothetical protein
MDTIAHALKVTGSAAIDGQRFVAAAKEMTDKSVPTVEAHRVGGQKPFHARHQGGPGRFDDQMKVVAHGVLDVRRQAFFCSFMSNQPPNRKRAAQPLQLIAAVVGAAFGIYCGLMILIPLGAAMVALLFGKRFASGAPRCFGAVLTVLFGHLIWMLTGALWLQAGFGPLLVDLAAIVIGSIWLMLRPGIGPVALLGIYELISLILNINEIFSYELGKVGHRAPSAHIALRLFALFALMAGYRQFLKGQADKTTMLDPAKPGDTAG